MSRSQGTRRLVLAVIGVLAVVACGHDDDDASTPQCKNAVIQNAVGNIDAAAVLEACRS